jgi:hypothetical protein
MRSRKGFNLNIAVLVVGGIACIALAMFQSARGRPDTKLYVIGGIALLVAVEMGTAVTAVDPSQ